MLDAARPGLFRQGAMIRFAAFLLAAAALTGAAPVRAQDAADLLVRISRMEQQMREMAGQIEQLQFQNRKLSEELDRFRKDTDLRFEDAGQGRARSGAAPPVAGAASPAVAGRRGDAFDPSVHPGAPGAPQALGTTAPSPPLRSGQPTIDRIIEEGRGPREAGVGAPLDLGGPAAGPPPRLAPPVAVSPSGRARDDFDAAIGMMQRGEYASAEMALRQFLQSHPRSNLVADATYWLGESYFQRGLHREAAEEYLRISTSWPQAGRAADAMLKLGMSLTALGAKDQACSTFREIDRKYPNASQNVKRGVEREFRRARCPA